MADVATQQQQQQADVQADAGAQQAQQPSAWSVVKSLATRMFILYFAMQAMGYFRQKPPVQTNTDPSNTNPYQPGNIYQKGAKFDMNIYLSDYEAFNEFDQADKLIWSLNDIEYGNWNSGPNGDGTFINDKVFQLTEGMKNNGSIYLHVFFTEPGRSPNPRDKETYSKRRTFSTFKRINKYFKRTYKTTKNLLTGSTEKDEDYQSKAKENLVEIISHWHPNLTINLIDDHTPWQKGQVPSPLNEHIDFDKSSGKYYPIIFLNDYWNLNADYQPINSTVSHVNLSLTFSHLQLWKWQLYLSQTMKNQWATMLADDSNDNDQDTIKRTLIETNPYLLALTVVITLIHNVFEFLAFKNDIQFWRNRKSLEGLSVNSVLFGCFTSFIVLLYVLDNDTNTVVKISIFIGLLIELWKIPKLINVSIDPEKKYLGLIPKLNVIHKASYVQSKTNDYDKLAFKYLSWALFPLVFGYAIYSLIYLEHKGWYSWLLSMIYGFLLTFGFIMMTPQLFINYKLKSVAHLPWRQMTYKALNTFIDDIFAFVIKMPTMYRLGCFRDDIIFFIYLYQRWIYPIDKKRTNEFGTPGEGEGQEVAVPNPAEASATATASSSATSDHIKSE